MLVSRERDEEAGIALQGQGQHAGEADGRERDGRHSPRVETDGLLMHQMGNGTVVDGASTSGAGVAGAGGSASAAGDGVETPKDGGAVGNRGRVSSGSMVNVANRPPLSERLLAAFFYGFCSLAVILCNKIVLTTYAFPSFRFLAFSQFVVTVVVLQVLHISGKIQLANLTPEVLSHVAPLSAFFFLNVITGLSGTQAINLPMFTALRRFSIFFTMLGEMRMFGTRPSMLVVGSVVSMLAGAIIAAANDLTFDAYGYFMIFLNNIFTAGSGVYTKRASNSRDVSKLSVLYYNSLFSACLLVIIFVPLEADHLGQDLYSFESWHEPGFQATFLLAAIMGCLLNYSIFLCTGKNSALTTTVVGCLKNVLTTYLGMAFIGGDYQFSVLNFFGLNISIVGSLVYSYATFRR